MTTACSCNIGFGNSKVPGCENVASVTHGLLLVPYFDNAGAINKIDLSVTLNAAFWAAWIADSDSSQRLRPFVGKKFQNPDVVRADSQYETFDSGDMVFIQSGDKKFSGLLPNSSPGVIKFFDSARCQKMGVFLVDIKGNLIGNASETGYLRPFRIQDNSIDAKDVPAKDKTSQRVDVRFNFARTEEDGDIGMILATEIPDIDLLALDGLYDAYGVFSGITTTALVVDVRTHYGTVLNPDRVEGMVKADFVLTNRGTGATVTITSVTENAITPGIYTFVNPTQTSGHKLKLTFTYAGYDSAELGEQIILIP